MTLNALSVAQAIRREVANATYRLSVNRNPDFSEDDSTEKGIVLDLVCSSHHYQLTSFTSAEILKDSFPSEIPQPEDCDEVYDAIDSKLERLPVKVECTESEQQIKDRVIEEGDFDCTMVLECLIRGGDWPKSGVCSMGYFVLDYLVSKEAIARIHNSQ